MKSAIKVNIKDKKKVIESLKDKGVTTMPLLYTELHQEILDACRMVLDKSKQAFELTEQLVVEQEGKLNLQQAASIANLMSPFLKVAEVVKESNMEMMHKSLEKMLLEAGAEKSER